MNMDHFVTFSSAYSLLKWIALLIQGFLWCASVIFFWKWVTNKKRQKIRAQNFPRIKTPYYSLLGHLRAFPPASVMKKMSLSLHAYSVQVLAGYCAIFQKFPLIRIDFGFKTVIVLTKQETVKELLSSNVFLKKSDMYDMLHQWLGTGLLTSHGSKWKSRRKLLTQSFHSDILNNFMPAFNEQSKILVDILKTKVQEDWIDIVKPITLCSLDIICETMLGARVGAQTDSESKYVSAVLGLAEAIVERALNPLLHPNIIFRFSNLGRRVKRDCDCVHNFTRKVILEKKQNLKSNISRCQEGINQENNSQCKKRKALMDLLLDVHMKNGEEFTEEHIREEVDTFVFEGHDTTSMGMSWTLYLIGLYPDVQAKIYEELVDIFGEDKERCVTLEDLKEMQYLERVIKESLRLYPPVSLFARKVEEDLSICDYKIKKGMECAVYAYWLHRDPDVFPDPEIFDPDRFLPENCIGRNPFAYVPFSAGPRNCIGQRFAMMEEKVVISNVLRNFHVKSLQPRDKIYPALTLILRSEYPLKLKFSLRTPNP